MRNERKCPRGKEKAPGTEHGGWLRRGVRCRGASEEPEEREAQFSQGGPNKEMKSLVKAMGNLHKGFTVRMTRSEIISTVRKAAVRNVTFLAYLVQYHPSLPGPRSRLKKAKSSLFTFLSSPVPYLSVFL